MTVSKRVLFVALALISGLTSVGCSSEPKDPFAESDAATKFHNYVPLTAKTVASGVGNLSYKVTEPGTLYLVDMNMMEPVPGTDVKKPKVLATGLVLKGMDIMFDPSQRWIHSKGKSGVHLTEVDASHLHELRFEPTSNAQGS